MVKRAISGIQLESKYYIVRLRLVSLILSHKSHARDTKEYRHDIDKIHQYLGLGGNVIDYFNLFIAR